MKKPAFQFYVGDWQRNPNLRRCSFSERGIWIDVMCIMHDQKEYGVLRWTLKEIARAVGCKLSELKSLQIKGVLKGADTGEMCDIFIYRPRHGRKFGDPVILIPEQDGPVWYSSRMVKDEYVRNNKIAPNHSPDYAPKPPIGEGPSTSTSTSSSTSVNKTVSGQGREEQFFAMFRRCSGDHITDDELKGEVGRFMNKYPNIHPNRAGALINSWVARIGEQPKTKQRIVV